MPSPDSTDCTSSTGRASSMATPDATGAVMPRSGTPWMSASQKYAGAVPAATSRSRLVTGSRTSPSCSPRRLPLSPDPSDSPEAAVTSCEYTCGPPNLRSRMNDPGGGSARWPSRSTRSTCWRRESSTSPCSWARTAM